MIVAGLALAAVLYAWGLARTVRARRRFPPRAVAAFALGLVAVALALLGPLDALSDDSLAWHMVQHLALISLAAPLMLLGAPARLALAALPSGAAAVLAAALRSRVLRALTLPPVALAQYALVLMVAHFSPLYEAALENETVHAFEHVLFLTSALIFWTPVLAVAPAPHAPRHPVRIAMLVLATPLSVFLGFSFYVARTPLYAHYAERPDALADQTNAGAVMWILGGVPSLLTLLWLLADWGAAEQRYNAIADERL